MHYATGDDQPNLSIEGIRARAPGTLHAGPVTVTNARCGKLLTLAIVNWTPRLQLQVGPNIRWSRIRRRSFTDSDFEGGWNMVAMIVPIALDIGLATVLGYEHPPMTYPPANVLRHYPIGAVKRMLELSLTSVEP